MGREFVFVHGMSHGAWCWDPLVKRLEGRGHRTLAVDLPGHGRRAHEWRRASVTTYARAVADELAAAAFFLPLAERVDFGRFHALGVPRTYVRCLGDAAVPPTRALDYAARLGVKPIDLDTAHDPMLSDPDALVAMLERI
jgi:pimeloyl-ACP methyl ester carboxylesterase